MKNVQVKIDNMGNAHVTADKDEMLVMATYELSYNGEYWNERYAINSTLAFSMTASSAWDVEYELERKHEQPHVHAARLKAMFAIASTVLALHKPDVPVKKEEVNEEAAN